MEYCNEEKVIRLIYHALMKINTNKEFLMKIIIRLLWKSAELFHTVSQSKRFDNCTPCVYLHLGDYPYQNNPVDAGLLFKSFFYPFEVYFLDIIL